MRLTLLTLLLLSALIVQAQDAPGAADYSSSFTMGFHLTHRGTGVEMLIIRGDPKNSWVYGLGFQSLKHLKETKIERSPVATCDEGPEKYTFGKLNRFWVVSPTIGKQWGLFDPGIRSKVKVLATVQAGPAIGLTNPYYLRICNFNQSTQTVFTTIEPYDPARHQYETNITGRAKLFSGKLKLKARLGLTLRSSMLFDFASDSQKVFGIQVSGQADLFFNKVPIMAEEIAGIQNSNIFLSAGLGLVFGSRN